LHRHLPLMRALACLALLACAGAYAEVSERLDTTYYEVGVQPGRALAPQIRAATPVRTDGRPFFGHTDWQVNWRFRWSQDGAGVCRFTSVNVELRSTITLPRLRGADARQSAAFERFMPALREHEMGHHRLAQEAARAIDNELRNFAAQRDCATLESQANAAGARLLERYRDKERQYDRDTDHGKSQGAWLEG